MSCQMFTGLASQTIFTKYSVDFKTLLPTMGLKGHTVRCKSRLLVSYWLSWTWGHWVSSPWWPHQMETFTRNWPFLRGIHRSPVNSPHKGQLRGTLKFSLTCAWINDWINNREAGDLRRYRTHYDVTVLHMITLDNQDPKILQVFQA